MEVSRIRALRGPNLWTRHTAVEAMVTCDAGEVDLSEHPDFEGRLRNLFPGVGNLQPPQHKVKLSMAHALEAATLHLQIEAGCPVTFSRTTPTTDHGLFQVAVEYSEEQVGCMAIKLAHQLCLAAFNNTSFDVDAAIHQLRELDEEIRVGPSTGSIVNAASRIGVSRSASASCCPITVAVSDTSAVGINQRPSVVRNRSSANFGSLSVP